MSFYKIYILNKKGRISFSYDFSGLDDLAALDESKKYSNRDPLEIWQQSRLVARVARGGEAPYDWRA